MKKLVGIVGWRGIVGSVLVKRMCEENDFDKINPIFLSTSKFGKKYFFLNKYYLIENAYNIDILMSLDIIITCQGSDYTNEIFFKLVSCNWKGYWIDASSNLRMNNNSIIVLDPINKKFIKESIENGIKVFVGGNCTVSLMLMALGGLFKENLIDWISVSTYQAASGSGAKSVLELLSQMNYLTKYIKKDIKNNFSILDIMHKFIFLTKKKNFPKKNFTVSLAGNVIPWIDQEMSNGQSKEEWKMKSETNKILNIKDNNICIDGICVRISSLRSHSQSFTIRLKKDISISSIKEIIKNQNQWVKIVSNDYNSSKIKLTPISVSETLNIPIGRIRKLNIGKKYLSAFTVGDQLLWGASEPLRRVLNFLI